MASSRGASLDVPVEVLLLPRVPRVDFLPLPAGRFLTAPVGADDLAVQDHVRGTLGQGALECLAQPGRLSGQDVDDPIEVPAGRRLRQPEARAGPRDAALVPEPCQAEQRLLVTAQFAGLSWSRSTGGGWRAGRTRTR